MFNLTVDNEISLRTLHPDDAETLFNLLERNRPRLRPWVDPSALPETVQSTRKYTIECFFNSIDPMEAMNEYYEYFRELNGYFPSSSPPKELGIWVNNSLSGVVTLSRTEDSFTAAEFGYWVTEEMEGKGIITRCVRALMEYAIDNMGIHRFIIGCAATNHRSRAVAERLGYRVYVTKPNGEVVGEFVYDRTIYGIRTSQWRERNKANS
jgi:ribosomal-protein-serine acetyltransferase